MRDQARRANPTNPNWIVIPFLDEWEMTKQTLLDCLRMRVGGRRPNVMLVDNGSTPESTGQAVLFTQACNDLIPDVDVLLIGNPAPGIPLNHAWNIALWQIWEFGGEQALVVNNDVELHEDTFAGLHSVMRRPLSLPAESPTNFSTWPLLISGIGVTPEQFIHAEQCISAVMGYPGNHGGPDFSCFLITRECHAKYPFDPRFTFAGDWDYHRRLIVGGDGDRIFGVNVPYLHLGNGSQTLKRLRERDPERAQLIADTADQHRALYAEKWGGTFGQETLTVPKWEVVF